MKFTSSFLSLGLTAVAFASPVAVPEEHALEERTFKFGRPTSASSAFKATPIIGCILPFQATAIVNGFNYLLANPKASNFETTANALLSNDFTDTSDSINQLAGIPEGSVTFASKADLIAGSTAQPPLILETLDIFWSCNAISWRWVSTSGAGNDVTPVKGIDNFYINPQGQIKSTYAEFNSGAWLANLGYPECSASSA
ncbi:uncharacterized protein LTR77_003387 [Saxophila tyrrhenica]|uniref:NTF2-like domain-containing protein n=1 Tax=Saxophila tyrrhenica TaxID=1690608 RepID=A0AAV9PGX7_9PEZI|nr:hypothetical protein LTR77_003387 [Saxophila tyrrhenica]